MRQLRRVAAFKISTRGLVIFLMVLGSWVATRQIDIPRSLGITDSATHIIVFFGFSVLLDLAISRHPFWLWKGLPLLMYGLGIEVMQYFTPNRTFSLFDWLADFSGILLYFMLKIILVWFDDRKKTNRR